MADKLIEPISTLKITFNKSVLISVGLIDGPKSEPEKDLKNL